MECTSLVSAANEHMVLSSNTKGMSTEKVADCNRGGVAVAVAVVGAGGVTAGVVGANVATMNAYVGGGVLSSYSGAAVAWTSGLGSPRLVESSVAPTVIAAGEWMR